MDPGQYTILAAIMGAAISLVSVFIVNAKIANDRKIKNAKSILIELGLLSTILHNYRNIGTLLQSSTGMNLESQLLPVVYPDGGVYHQIKSELADFPETLSSKLFEFYQGLIRGNYYNDIARTRAESFSGSFRRNFHDSVAVPLEKIEEIRGELKTEIDQCRAFNRAIWIFVIIFFWIFFFALVLASGMMHPILNFLNLTPFFFTFYVDSIVFLIKLAFAIFQFLF